MKILVLSRGPTLYSTRRLVSVARRRGHRVSVLDPMRLSIAVKAGRAHLYAGAREVEAQDAVIPRIGASITYYGLAVLRQLEARDTLVLNRADAIATARDKLRALQALTRAGVRVPDTAFARPAGAARGIDHVGGAPVVIKLLEGTQGRGVVLAESKVAARSVIDAFHELDEPLLLQRFIAEAGGRDVRAFVVGSRVVATMERQAQRGEFRSNLHLGGRARRIDSTRAIERIAVRATRALGLDVAGVDVLIDRAGPMVLEVNSSPGLEGIEGSTGVNVAGEVIDLIEARLGLPQERRARRRA